MRVRFSRVGGAGNRFVVEGEAKYPPRLGRCFEVRLEAEEKTIRTTKVIRIGESGDGVFYTQAASYRVEVTDPVYRLVGKAKA